MAHSECDGDAHDSTVVANPKALSGGTPTPRKAGKRSAGEEQLPQITSTPMCSAKKPFLESDRASVSALSLNVSSLNQSTCSSRSRTARTSLMRITRGVQTTTPESFNRYCQVTSTRVRKPTTTVSQQTEAVFVLSEPPPSPPSVPEKALCSNASCQTDEPAVQEACIGTSQHVIDSPVRQVVDGWTQTKDEDQSMPLGSSTPIRAATATQLDKDVTGGGSVDSFATMLNNLAKEFGIDLSSVEQQAESVNKKKPKGGKQKDPQVVLQESLVNNTTKAVTTLLEQKMSTILQNHLAAYDRKVSHHRQKFIGWMKTYQTRQQQLEAKIRLQAPRRVLVVRKRRRRPAVREKSIQCNVIPTTPAREAGGGVTVGTQWQRQKPTVTKRKTPQKRTTTGTKIKSKISTDVLPAADEVKHPSPPTGGTRPGSLRQTKLSSYTEAMQQQQQQQLPSKRQQQRKCSPKLPVKGSSPPPIAVGPKPARKKPSPPRKEKPKGEGPKPKSKSNTKQIKERTPEIFIEETPSEPSDTDPAEVKYYPYRTQLPYPSQCSKSTETSFLTPTKARHDIHGPMEGGQPKQQTAYHRNAFSGKANPAVLISPMGRMFVRSGEPAASYSSFVVPMAASTTGAVDEVVSPTPQNVVYVNRPERRVLLRSKAAGGQGLVREKPPELNIISSQQLYSQIGLAVEKALKNRKIPSLDTMYGEPFMEVFNGEEDKESANGKDDEDTGGFGKRRDRFVCSSANDEQQRRGAAEQYYGSSRQPVAPFHTDRSPSLSPIVYRDDDSEEEFL